MLYQEIRSDYDKKLQIMMDEGITNGTYAPTTDFYVAFQRQTTHYKDMGPVSNQPARLYATAKTHKFNSLDEIIVENLKFRPIIFASGYIYVQ